LLYTSRATEPWPEHSSEFDLHALAVFIPMVLALIALMHSFLLSLFAYLRDKSPAGKWGLWINLCLFLFFCYPTVKDYTVGHARPEPTPLQKAEKAL
jgi:hypothetical protein